MAAFALADAEKLQNYFKQVNLPDKPIYLNQYEVIEPKKFTEAHLQIILTNYGKEVFNPYYNRLLALKKIIESNEILFAPETEKKIIPQHQKTQVKPVKATNYKKRK